MTLRALLIISGGAMLVTLLTGWLIWGRAAPDHRPLSEQIVGNWKNIDDKGTMIYDSLRDGEWEQRIIPTMAGGSPDSPEVKIYYDNPFTGKYRVEGETVQMRMRISNCAHEPGHLIDIMATCIEISGAEYPKRFAAHDILPAEGRSLTGGFAADRTELNDLSKTQPEKVHELGVLW